MLLRLENGLLSTFLKAGGLVLGNCCPHAEVSLIKTSNLKLLLMSRPELNENMFGQTLLKCST